MSKILLPKTYNNPESEYHGYPKLSYSQYTSWKSIKYKPQYVKQYMAGISLPSGVYAEFGSACGTFIEGVGTNNMDCHKEYSHLLSDNDRHILRNLDYPENSIYEDLITVDLGNGVVVEGYIDRSTDFKNGSVAIRDFKTGSIAKKSKEYASLEYGQTTLYSYDKVTKGYDIESSGVILLDRKGNNTEKHPLRLTGEILYIPTEYSKERAEAIIKDMRKASEEISEYYTKYVKLFK